VTKKMICSVLDLFCSVQLCSTVPGFNFRWDRWPTQVDVIFDPGSYLEQSWYKTTRWRSIPNVKGGASQFQRRIC